MSNISTDLQDVEKIIVLDYGSQYNQLISRRIREIGVFSELKSHKISAAEVRAINPVGIILSGGPNSVYEDGSFDIDQEIFDKFLRNRRHFIDNRNLIRIANTLHTNDIVSWQ